MTPPLPPSASFRMRLVTPAEWQRLAGEQCLIERLPLMTAAGPIEYDGIPEGDGVYAVSDAFMPEGGDYVLVIEDFRCVAIERAGDRRSADHISVALGLGPA